MYYNHNECTVYASDGQTFLGAGQKKIWRAIMIYYKTQ